MVGLKALAGAFGAGASPKGGGMFDRAKARLDRKAAGVSDPAVAGAIAPLAGSVAGIFGAPRGRKRKAGGVLGGDAMKPKSVLGGSPDETLGGY